MSYILRLNLFLNSEFNRSDVDGTDKAYLDLQAQVVVIMDMCIFIPFYGIFIKAYPDSIDFQFNTH